MRTNTPKGDTIPKLFLESCQRWGDSKVAMRKKDFGIWNEYTWQDCYDEVRNLAGGLRSLGFDKGDKLAVIGDNSPEWFFAEYAAQALGGVVVGLYTDAIRSELAYIVGHSDTKIVVADDQEQVDKFLDIRNDLPRLERVIYWDPKGMWSYDDPMLSSWDEVIEIGKKYAEEHPNFFEESISGTKIDDLALLLYTSGTSALPKGAMLAHRLLAKAGGDWVEQEDYRSSEQYVSYMSPAWIAEQLFGLGCLVLSNIEVNFPEAPETVQEDIREIGPHMLFFGSRLWESVAATIQAKISDATWLKRLAYHQALRIGYKAADLRLAKKPIDPLLRIAYGICEPMVFRPLRDKVGCLRARHAYTGGALLSPDTIKFFHGINIRIKNNYGLTEATATLQHDNDISVDSVGVPVTNTVAIRDDGEIVIRGDATFDGYYKNPEATQTTIDEDGWVHTGDAGYFTEDGHLIYMDRVKELIELKDGAKFSPAFIEGKLRFSVYIGDAMIIGGKDRDFVSAIIQIDYENVGRWAEAHRISYTTFSDLSQKDEVIALIGKDVARVNASLPEAFSIKRYCNMYKQFDPDEAELTRTRKLRRGFMEQRYEKLLAGLYSGDEECELEVEVVYQDGRKSKMKTPVKLVSA